MPAEMEPVVKFINLCTSFEPEKRPTASQAVATLAKMLKEFNEPDRLPKKSKKITVP